MISIVILIACFSFACLFIIFLLHLIKISKCCYFCHFFRNKYVLSRFNFTIVARHTQFTVVSVSRDMTQCLLCGSSSSIKPSNTLNLLRHNSFTVSLSLRLVSLLFLTLGLFGLSLRISPTHNFNENTFTVLLFSQVVFILC